MGQKVDLRIPKTQKAIREAFLEIRGRQPLEKVTVREICQAAMINTSTFYNHYRDVTNLSEQLESELLDACFRSMPSLDDLFTEPYRFLAELRRCFSDSREAEDLSILFDGRCEAFYQKIDAFLLQRYQSAASSREEYVKISFVLGGILYTGHLLRSDIPDSLESLEHSLAELISRLK